MKKKPVYSVLFLFICLALPLLTLAQGPPDPEDTPIDGGLVILLAAGVVYGVKKYRDGSKATEAGFELK